MPNLGLELLTLWSRVTWSTDWTPKILFFALIISFCTAFCTDYIKFNTWLSEPSYVLPSYFDLSLPSLFHFEPLLHTNTKILYLKLAWEQSARSKLGIPCIFPFALPGRHCFLICVINTTSSSFLPHYANPFLPEPSHTSRASELLWHPGHNFLTALGLKVTVSSIRLWASVSWVHCSPLTGPHTW